MYKLISVFLLCSLAMLPACSKSSDTPSGAPDPFDLFIEADDQQIHIGNSTYLKAYSRDRATGEVTEITYSVNFSADNPEIAQIEPYASKVTALTEGVATFSTTYYNEKASTVIRTRDGYITGINVNSSDNNLHVGSKGAMTAQAVYDDGSFDNVTENSDWKTENDWVAYFPKTDGLVYANNPGTTNVYALLDGISSNFQEVIVHRGTMVGLELRPFINCCPVHKGQIAQFQALSLWDDGDSDYVTTSAQWFTSNADILKQIDDKKNYFKAENIGVAAISGLYNGFYDTLTITVDRALVSNLRVEMDAEILDIDQEGMHYWIPNSGSTQLTAFGDLSDGTTGADVSDLVEWRWATEDSQGNGSIEIDGELVAHGLTTGMVVIYVQVDGTSSAYRGAVLWIGNRP